MLLKLKGKYVMAEIFLQCNFEATKIICEIIIFTFERMLSSATPIPNACSNLQYLYGRS